MEDVEAIVSKLTTAQTKAITEALEYSPVIYGDGAFEVRAGGATVALCKRGIIREREWRSLTGRSRRGYALTPRGIAVRTHLLSQTKE